MNHSRTSKFRISDWVTVDASGRAQCPSCLEVGKTGKNLSVTLKGQYEGAYKCFRGCSPEEIRKAIGQPKIVNQITQTSSKRDPKALVSDAIINSENAALLASNGPAIEWLKQRGITMEMTKHYRLGITRCNIAHKGKQLKRMAISIPIPAIAVDQKYYRKKRICPWDAETAKLDGYRKWSQWGLPAIVFYTHQPSSPTQTWIVEGEWDAMLLGWILRERSDIAVATFTCGAGRVAAPDQLNSLEGQIVSFYDQNDSQTKNGTIAARESEKLLHRFFGQRYGVGIPPMHENESKAGYDVSDAIQAGFTISDFIQAAQQAHQIEPPDEPQRKTLKELLTWNDELVARAPDYINWLVEGLLTSNEMFLLAAGPRCGKSLLSMTLAHAVGAGDAFLGRPTTQGTVIYVHCEDSEGKIKERIRNQGWGEHLPIAWLERFKISRELKELRDLIREHDVKLVILDTLSRIKDGSVSESSAEMSQLLEPLQDIAQREECCILLVHHIGKLQADNATETDIFDRVRGSSAIRATCRGTMILAAGKQHHRLLTENGWKKEDLKIRLDTSTTRWELIGEWEESKNIPQRAQILNFLQNVDEASIEQIHQATGIPTRSLYQQLSRLQLSVDIGEKVVKRGSKRKYTYAIDRQQTIQQLNSLLKRPNAVTETNTGYYSTKNTFFTLDNREKLDTVTDTMSLNFYVDSFVDDSSNPFREGLVVGKVQKSNEFQRHILLNRGENEPLSLLIEGVSPYSTTIQQNPFVEYNPSFCAVHPLDLMCQFMDFWGGISQQQWTFLNSKWTFSTCDTLCLSEQWMRCSPEHKPPLGATVRFFPVSLEGDFYTVERLHAVHVGLKAKKDGRNVLADLDEIEALLPLSTFVCIDDRPYKVIERKTDWIVVVQGDHGKKRFRYSFDTGALIFDAS